MLVYCSKLTNTSRWALFLWEKKTSLGGRPAPEAEFQRSIPNKSVAIAFLLDANACYVYLSLANYLIRDYIHERALIRCCTNFQFVLFMKS